MTADRKEEAALAKAWASLKASWDEFIVKMDSGGKQRAVNAPGQLTSKDLVADATAFLKEKEAPDIIAAVAQATERMRINQLT